MNKPATNSIVISGRYVVYLKNSISAFDIAVFSAVSQFPFRFVFSEMIVSFRTASREFERAEVEAM